MVPEVPPATKVLFPKVTSRRCFSVPEVTLSKDDPLSVDLNMVPDDPSEAPTNTKVLFPKVTPRIFCVIPEVTLSKDDPLSVDLNMVPDLPTKTNTPEPEEEESSEEETVKEVIVREPLNFFSEFSLGIVLETVIVQSAYVPSLRELKVMVLLPSALCSARNDNGEDWTRRFFLRCTFRHSNERPVFLQRVPQIQRRQVL